MNNERETCEICFGEYIADNAKEHQCPEEWSCGACGEICEIENGTVTNNDGYLEFTHKAELCPAQDEIGLLCNMCGNTMTDTEAHSFFQPIGEICEECTTETNSTKEGNK